MGNCEFISLEEAIAKDWLNARIGAIRNLKRTDRLSDRIITGRTELEVRLYSGIDALADALGEKLQWECCDGMYRYHFPYDGVEVSQRTQERLEGTADAEG